MKTNPGETILYSGRDDNEDHQFGVAVMMAKGVAKMLLQWNPVSDRIIVARFNLKTYQAIDDPCVCTNKMKQKRKSKMTSMSNYKKL